MTLPGATTITVVGRIIRNREGIFIEAPPDPDLGCELEKGSLAYQRFTYLVVNPAALSSAMAGKGRLVVLCEGPSVLWPSGLGASIFIEKFYPLDYETAEEALASKATEKAHRPRQKIKIPHY